MVQWLRLCASTAWAQFQSLVGELRSHMQCSAAKKKKKIFNKLKHKNKIIYSSGKSKALLLDMWEKSRQWL